MPGVHHVLCRAYKDANCRFKTMQGYVVERAAGWDCHGLPVECAVQKQLGLEGPRDVHAFGLRAFNRACRESVWVHERAWEEMTQRMGYWLDMRGEVRYATLDNDYMESEWWALRTLFDKGLLYKGLKVLPYCPGTGATYSSHELDQPGAYKEVTQLSVFVAFPLRGAASGSGWGLPPAALEALLCRASLLVWTTTPWSLFSNVALAVDPSARYVRVRADMADGSGSRQLVCAAACVAALNEQLAPVLASALSLQQELMGADLLALSYCAPLVAADDDAGDDDANEARPVLPADFVEASQGTGVVHVAPCYGADDFALARAHGLRCDVHTVDLEGRLMANATHPSVAGLPALGDAATAAVLKLLAAHGALVGTYGVAHRTMHCWRTGMPLMYYAMESWFVRMSALRSELTANNTTVKWAPPAVGEHRFGHWLRGACDWALSRNRWWGTPLPVWTCAGCGHVHCVGSREELTRLAAVGACVPTDLHRDALDPLKLVCAECGGAMVREPFVLDCWFDSGCAPFAAQHYPFRGQAGPPPLVDFVAEGVDQTRGWFYTMLALSTALFGAAAYRSVLAVGLVLDAHGHKMSKSKGNTVDPWELFASDGADAVRWALLRSGAPWAAHRVDAHAVACTRVKFLGTLWNVFRWLHVRVKHAGGFGALASARDPADGPDAASASALPAVDRWVLSRVASVALEVDGALRALELHRATYALEGFVQDDLSNWYLKFVRTRFAGGKCNVAMAATQRHALRTLRSVLLLLCRLLAPLTPFVADYLYRALADGASVHLASWPVGDGVDGEEEQRSKCDPAGTGAVEEPRGEELGRLVDTATERKMHACRELVRAGRRLRERANWPGRLQVARAWLGAEGGCGGAVVVGESTAAESLEELLPLVAEELNCAHVDCAADLSRFHDDLWSVNFRSLGRRCKGDLPAVKAALAAMPPARVSEALAASGQVVLAGYAVSREEMQLVRTPLQAFSVAASDPASGAPALVLEFAEPNAAQLSSWVARELVHAAQMRRKALGVPLGAAVALHVWADAAALQALLPTDWERVLADVRAEPGVSMLHEKSARSTGSESKDVCDNAERWQELKLQWPGLPAPWHLGVLVQRTE